MRWRASLWVDGRRETSTHPLESQAWAWLGDLRSAVSSGTGASRGGDMLFRDWAEIWWGGRDTLGSADSREADRSRLDNHLLPAFGRRRLGDIRSSDVRTWVNGLKRVDGRGKLAPKTVKECHALLSQILDAAIDDEELETNPCRSPSGRRTRLPQVPRTDKVMLTGPQVRALIDSHPPQWRPMVTLIAATGLRFSEVAGLTVRHLDLDRCLLRVRSTYTEKNGWTKLTKSHASWRTVTFPSLVGPLLAPLVAGKGLDDPVFAGRTGGPVRRRNFGQRVWSPAVARAGLADLGPLPHALRHLQASVLGESGLSSAAQQRLGHAQLSTTHNIYTHAMAGADDAALAVIELMLTGVPDTPEGI